MGVETMDGHRSKWPWDMAGDRHSAEIALPSVGIDAIGRDLGEILRSGSLITALAIADMW
ncbi:MAG: hypothetical protein EA001_14075 [Oscillatoriales cyanobacterium]|nr:MAG: hypothetical protein EA001_14075 [Oscillatoriales cyanobacterium]